MSMRKPLSSYRSPGTWPVWIGMGLLRLVCLLPHRVALWIGRVIGRLAYRFAGSRREVVRRNLALCFRAMPENQLDDLTREHFEALGMMLIETGLGRWASDRRLRSITTLTGVEHVNDALESGQGVILLSAHFTTLEIMGRVLATEIPPFDAVFRKNRSEFMTELQRSGREVSAESTIEKRDIKKMVRSLRNGRAVWYAPDQSYNRKGSEVIEFFGIPALHTTATSTLARLGNAVTIPFFPLRKRDGTYEMTLLPPLENFPSDDPVADTKRYVALLEEHIRKATEQYFWIHRKFKDLPAGYPDYYADLDASK
ncbi:MAG: lysophospholipid acyltransferase family protein [Gammaproteobacteria bacterium]|nr:lysophospholipid acyltransferase family protein [Gammaproteobacteria bacterium]NNF49392.1 lipid A biosynthesis acyltransferase [Woeseiaceae bacterium]MBT8093535.1 lysophospholipid acyltransferase family protein [Gammaproteobacteria bacterium]MBT8106501.1 lysophospholipid acyltransferase family protein [Gammaproteobacteria bacterium]NNK26516.1 lipid A biosynthesis acyltransferase [Woeseiaceae bacterium]